MKTVFVHIAAIVVFATFLSACDSPYQYIFYVTNHTGEPVQVEAVAHNNKNSSITIPEGKTIDIYSEQNMTSNHNYVPEDLYMDRNSWRHLPPYKKFEVYAGNTLLSDSVRLRKYWDYSAKKLLGTYTLNVTEELVSNLAQLNIDN